MEKLELKHLAPYFPYGLKGRVDKETYLQEENDRIGELKTIDLADHNYELAIYGDLGYFLCDIYDFKPILRPLSNLTKEIEHNGKKFVPIFEIYNLLNNLSSAERKKLKAILNKDFNGKYVSKAILDFKGKFNAIYIKHNEVLKCSYEVIQKLLEWHFDIFGLIEKGLAVDVNSLSE